jgi:hypothetical protein
MRVSIALLLLACTAASAAAQSAPGRGDTLRFLQTVKGTGEMQMPTGSQQMTSNMRTQMSLAFLGGDSAVAWMDSVDVTTDPPSPIHGVVSQLLGKRMPLRFLPDGRVQMDDSVVESLGLAGFSSAQGGFTLPRRGELRPGATWSDTTTVRRSNQGVSMNITTITRFRVVGDSVYHGMPVLVVAFTSTVNTETAGSSGASSMQINGTGEGTGRSYFSRALGLIVFSASDVTLESVTRFGDMSVTARNRAETTMMLKR